MTRVERRIGGDVRPGRVRRIAKLAMMLVIFVTLAGVTYQGVSTAIERREYPPTGVLVPVGAHQLHLSCTGSGAPIVVLEAPALGMSSAWAWLTPLLTIERRVCAYDRAGLGWSESGDQGFDPLLVPDELRAALAYAQEPAPFVLVGQGLGASFARLYAARFPPDLLGLVLVDEPEAGASLDEEVARLVRLSPWLARSGILRATRTLSRRARSLPGRPGGAMRSFLNRPDHLTRGGHELGRWNDIVAIGAQSQLPLIPTRSVAVAGDDPLGMITSEEQAQRVAAAIREVVEGP